MQFRTDNLTETISLTAKLLKLDEAAVKADSDNCQIFSPAEWDAKTTDGTTTSWLKGMGDYFLAAKKITSNPAPSEWYLGDLFTSAK
jgi:NitT/TauT family transport system substrate-binding protein